MWGGVYPRQRAVVMSKNSAACAIFFAFFGMQKGEAIAICAGDLLPFGRIGMSADVYLAALSLSPSSALLANQSMALSTRAAFCASVAFQASELASRLPWLSVPSLSIAESPMATTRPGPTSLTTT